MEIIKKSNYVSPIITLPNDNDPKELRHKAMQELRDNGMTIKQVAEIFGVSTTYVFNHTEKRIELRGHNSSATRRLIYEARKAYYVPLMQELRSRGYNNADIAKKTGFHIDTIRTYIGKQPDEISLASHRVAGAKRRLRHLAVRNQAARDEGKPIPAVAEIIEQQTA